MFLYKPHGYQADDLRLPFAYTFFFLQHIRASRDSAIHVYGHTCACPNKAAQMYFGRVSPKTVLGVIEFPQFVQTMIGQVVCADLSVFFHFYGFLITTAISATETK